MSNDELAIRALVTAWFAATAANDIPRILDMMADDVIFIGGGGPPMHGRDAYAAAARAMDGKFTVTGTPDIQEIRVIGDWAWCWNQIDLTLHPADGTASLHRSGPALSILHREPDGRWVVFRDANMVGPAAPVS